MTQDQGGADAMAVAGVPRQVTARATWLLAPNAGPMTFDGTNSWVLHEPGRRGAVIVDPGPDDDRHLAALLRLAAERGGRVDAILLTHGHPDHTAGVRKTARRTGAPVLAADPRWADRVIGDCALEVAGLSIDVIRTPGHSSDSLSFRLPAEQSMVTGDTVLGRSAPVILDPDGRVDQMIRSLERIRRVLDGGQPVILPGHGPVVTEPAAQLTLALAARQARLAQVEEAVRDGCRTVAAIADRLYGPFDERIRRPVEATVRAHLRYLSDHGGLSSPVQIDG
ncbi:MAG TPA: MBL fold metallo-hydrolase [Trebonia sp.]|jgi:glyoxylase-like metal-dependent hydrolase (beta-lactamase superfamily II)|nr:MBL fold metallo-hydrolase [Trebonia sp.]